MWQSLSFARHWGYKDDYDLVLVYVSCLRSTRIMNTQIILVHFDKGFKENMHGVL